MLVVFFSSFNTTPVPEVKCRICKLVIHSAISYHIRVKFYGFQGQHCPKFIPECLLRLMFYIPTQWNQIKKQRHKQDFAIQRTHFTCDNAATISGSLTYTQSVNLWMYRHCNSLWPVCHSDLITASPSCLILCVSFSL